MLRLLRRPRRPGQRLPQVARLPNASNVRVFGCTRNPSWCDVLSGRTRGSVPINDLSQSSRLRSADHHVLGSRVLGHALSDACVAREPRQLARLGHSGMAAAGRKATLTVTARGPACVQRAGAAGRPARMVLEKSAPLPAACAAAVMRERLRSSSKGIVVSTAPAA